VVAGRIDIHVLEQLAETARRSDILLELNLQLLDLEGLRSELAVEQEEVSQAFGEVVVPLLDLVGKGQLVVLVEFEASHDVSQGHVEQRDYQRTLRPTHNSQPVADVVVLMLALLIQEDV